MLPCATESCTEGPRKITHGEVGRRGGTSERRGETLLKEALAEKVEQAREEAKQAKDKTKLLKEALAEANEQIGRLSGMPPIPKRPKL